jgi:iron(III) transport system permease protein
MFRVGRFSSWHLFVPLAAAVALLTIGLLSSGGTRQAMANSAILAVGTTAIALPLGTLLAVLLTRFDLVGRRVAAAGLGVLLFLPLYVQLSGWDAALGKLGWYALTYGSIAEPFLAGMRGAVFVHAMAVVPWVALLVGLGLLQVDPAQEEAALLAVPPQVVLLRITLPQTIPFVIAAAVWTVVSTTSEMTVTNIFLMNPGERTYTEQFYMTFALRAAAGEASLAVLPGMAGLVVIVVGTLWMIAQYGRRPALVTTRSAATFSSGSLRPVLAALLWVIVLGLVAVPVASLIYKAGLAVVHEEGHRIRSWSAVKCLTEVTTAPRRFGLDFCWTLVVAFASATLALFAGAGLAWQARRGGWRAVPAIGATVLGLAIPGPLVGVVLIWLLNHDLPPEIMSADGRPKSWLLVLYDETPLSPVLAQTVRALPLVTVICWYSFRTLSDDVLSAAALDGATPRQVLLRIALPQRWSAVCGGWLAAFAVAAGDLAWAHLVTPPGMDLIQRRVFGLVHSGVEEQVAAISLVNVVAYALLAVLIQWLIAWSPGRRLSSRR